MIVLAIATSILAIVNAGVACFVFYVGFQERSALLDRIQAPEVARLRQVTEALDDIPTAEDAEAQAGISVPWDDDLRLIPYEEEV